MAESFAVEAQNTVGGYDRSIFYPPVDDTYICPVCEAVLRSPVQTGCGNRVCQSCAQLFDGELMCPLTDCTALRCTVSDLASIHEMYKKKNLKNDTPLHPSERFSLDMRMPTIRSAFDHDIQVFKDRYCEQEIADLWVDCRNNLHGCWWSGPLKLLEEHQKNCKYKIVMCPYRERGCRTIAPYPEIRSHASQDCLYRDKKCPHCAKTVPLVTLQLHICDECAEVPQQCSASHGAIAGQSQVTPSSTETLLSTPNMVGRSGFCLGVSLSPPHRQTSTGKLGQLTDGYDNTAPIRRRHNDPSLAALSRGNYMFYGSSREDVTGGYDVDFVDPLEDRDQCAVCLFALRDPVQTECGHRYCSSCFNGLKRSDKPRCLAADCGEALTATPGYVTFYPTEADLKEQSVAEESSMTSTHAVGSTEPIPSRATLCEKDIPYTAAHLLSSLIEEEGGRLRAGGVTVTYPPGSLPVGTPIGMMVAELESSFRYDGSVALSPQVTLTSHDNLRFPVNLTLPLSISEGHEIVVMKSKTACMDPLAWTKLPKADYSVEKNGVVIKINGNTIYQALCGPEDLTMLEIVGEIVHFSLQQRSLGLHGKHLCLRFSDRKDACYTAKEGFQFAGPADALSLRHPPCLDLQVIVKSVDESIIQRDSPYELSGQDINHPLNERFYVRIAQRGESSEGYFKKLTSFFRSAQEANSQDWSWLVEPVSSYPTSGKGRLAIHPVMAVDAKEMSSSPVYMKGHLSDTMVFKQLSGPGVSMPFVLYWAQSGHEVQPNPGGAFTTNHSVFLNSRELQTHHYEEGSATAAAACRVTSSKVTEPVETAMIHNSFGVANVKWRTAKLADVSLRTHLFTDICDTSRPFSNAWRDILRRLPAVANDGSLLGKTAFPGADNEIRCILESVHGDGSSRVSCECLRQTLNQWVDSEGGGATAGHLRDVLDAVKLGAAADQFFADFFRNF